MTLFVAKSKQLYIFERKFKNGQATKSLCVDDLAREGEEGRGKRRYAPGSRKQTLIRGHPNGATLSGLYR